MAQLNDTQINGNLTVTFNNSTPSVQLSPLTNKWWASNGATDDCFSLRAGTSADIGFEVRTSGSNEYLDVYVDGKVYVNEGADELIYSLASGTSQGYITANGITNVSVKGLTNTDSPNFNALATSSKITCYSSANPSTVAFETGGQVKAGSFNATSDARLKENFKPLDTQKSILELPVYRFNFIGEDVTHIGCKAQDLQEICPEIVNEGSDGYLSIQESKIVYLLLEEVKKLREEVTTLKGVIVNGF